MFVVIYCKNKNPGKDSDDTWRDVTGRNRLPGLNLNSVLLLNSVLVTDHNEHHAQAHHLPSLQMAANDLIARFLI